MLNLYWKIFLGFWLTGLLLGSGAIIVSQQLRQETLSEIQGLSPAEIVNRTSFIIRRLPEDIGDWRFELAENDVFFYTDTQLSYSLAQPRVPPPVQAFFETLHSQERLEKSSLMRLMVGKQETSINGEQINFVLDMPSTVIFQLKQLAEHFVVQILLALSISALACFILARYLTRNVKQISEASRLLASGDLNARAAVKKRGLRDELTLLGQDFNHMATSLQTGIENQKRLVRDISHELRSPLARLQIALELARQHGNSKELDRIETEANRLNELIGQLLSMPEEAANLNDTVDLCELLNTIIDDNTIEANNKQVALQFSSTQTEALVAASATQLHSALENIIRNAIHYTDKHTDVQISVTTQSDTKIEPGALAEGFRIAVRDCGPGIPEPDLDAVFQPFYRVDPARNRKTGGYGVGLAIAQRVIANHNGHIKAVNTDDGLLVEVLLPAAEQL